MWWAFGRSAAPSAPSLWNLLHNLSKIIHQLPLLNIDPKTIFSWLLATNVNFLIAFYGFTVFKSLILKPRSQFFAEIKIFILAYFLKQSCEVFTMCKSRKYEDFRKAIFIVFYIMGNFDYFLENTFKRLLHNKLLGSSDGSRVNSIKYAVLSRLKLKRILITLGVSLTGNQYPYYVDIRLFLRICLSALSLDVCEIKISPGSHFVLKT